MDINWTGERSAGSLLYLAYADCADVAGGGQIFKLTLERELYLASGVTGVNLGTYDTPEQAAGAIEAYGPNYNLTALKEFRASIGWVDRSEFTGEVRQ